MPHRRHQALLAVLALAAPLAATACADADRVAYFALVGEAPGDKPLYTGVSPSARFGRPAPPNPEAAFRPPPLPEAPTGDAPAGAAADAARQARQTLSDRASDYELRTRYLRANVGDYQAVALLLRPVVGQPLPPHDGRTQARLARARQALARIQGDVLSLHGIVQRAEPALAQARRALAALRAAGAAAAPLVQPLEQGIGSIDGMLKAGDRLVAAHVEWLADQRSALDALEDEIRRGIAAGPGLMQRESITE